MRYHAGKPIESVVYCLNNKTAFIQARVLYGKLSKAYNKYCCDTLQKSMHPRREQQHSRPKDKVSFFSDGRLCTLNGDEFLLKAPRQTKGSISSHGGIPLARHVISSFPTRRRDCVTGYRLYAIREQHSLDG